MKYCDTVQGVPKSIIQPMSIHHGIHMLHNVHIVEFSTSASFPEGAHIFRRHLYVFFICFVSIQHLTQRILGILKKHTKKDIFLML